MFVMTPGEVLPVSVSAVIWAPAVTFSRATLPMTWEGSVKAPGRIALRSTVLVVTWFAAIRVDSGMSALATTTGPVVGGGVACRRSAAPPD